MATVFKRGGKRAKGAYYASWFDHNGKRQTKSTRTTDKATAERIARQYEADAALRREGVIDPALEAISKQAAKTVADHLKDFTAKMTAAGDGQQHINTTVGYIRRIAAEQEFTAVSDIAADGVNTYAQNMIDAGDAARTVQAHLTAIKGFTKWLAQNHKLPRDPLASVKKPDPNSDRRKERRMLLHDEWDWLRATTANGPVRYGISAERVLLYATAIQTGLRARELESLSRGRLFLSGDTPYITCKSGSTKNKKEARQYVKQELAQDLQALIATKSPQATVFKMPSKFETADMLREDLAESRKEWLKAARHDPDELPKRREDDFLLPTNHDGEVLDFHALRHTCGAWLAMTGAHPKAVQAIMRHSTITLTMDTYGHLFPGQEADTVAKLNDMLTGPDVLAATGTDDTPAPNPPKRSAGRSRRHVRSARLVRQGATEERIHVSQKPHRSP